jgi:hypothetical protein
VPAAPRPSTAVATTRRTAVGAALAGLLAVSACDAGRDVDSGGPGVSQSEDPDAALVRHVVGEISTLVALVSAVEARYPRLRGRVRPFRDLHEAHLRALDATASEVDGQPRLTGADQALRVVRSREEQGRRRLVEAAVSARSGALASTLASMSAGVAQRLALESGDAGGERG